MELIIFIGIQGTGKSTFYKERFYNTHLRINLDMLKTRHRESVLFQTCLRITQRMVIDNTNPTPEDRARYIIPAREAGFRVAGYYFQSRIRDALARNMQREGKERIPEKGVRATHARLVRPAFEEGFDELFYVYIDENGVFRVQEWRKEHGGL
ncbi:MAG: AAA family ATPase [Candidatus Latescibacterota bacterium]